MHIIFSVSFKNDSFKHHFRKQQNSETFDSKIYLYNEINAHVKLVRSSRSVQHLKYYKIIQTSMCNNIKENIKVEKSGQVHSYKFFKINQ